MTLCTYLEGINKKMEELSKNQLFEHFNKLLQVSIFYTSSIHDNQISALITILVSTIVQLIAALVDKTRSALMFLLSLTTLNLLPVDCHFSKKTNKLCDE